ncbi:MAG TPA: DAK2 domain-containing protein [Oscillospiraceae bacterium]|nr:DAK2 domain-containing protein [Oscillospiraceae bacterium]
MLEIEYIDGSLLKKMIILGAQSLEKNKDIVNSLNVFPVPDGDTGTNMSLTMQSAVREVKAVKTGALKDIADAAANGSLMGARGNSGVILSQLFRGFAKGIKGRDKINTKNLAEALMTASDVAYKAVMKPVEGTILTVARESAEAALIISNTEKDIITFIGKVVVEAEKSLSRTPGMLKVLEDAGVVDSGGKGLVYIYSGILAGIRDGHVFEEDSTIEDDYVYHTGQIDGEIEFGYCTEFIIHADNLNIDKFKKTIGGYGDSILVVGNNNIVKVHIHTDHPGEIIEHALGTGQLSDIKIDNMRLQHEHEIFKQNEKKINVEDKNKVNKYGFIVVAAGEGLIRIFKDFTFVHVIEGGQTMNPSTEDFVNAIENIDAETIIILPNNSNVFMAANQAGDISDKNIIVIPSKSIPQGLVALLSFDFESTPEANEETMIEAIKMVKTAQVTYAVRDTDYNGLEIHKGDILGICDDEIKSVGNDVRQVCISLIEKAVTDESEIITIFYGSDITEEEANEILDELTNKYEDVDVELYYGGQPLYYYIFSIE